ncbi:hypothetical protein C7U88_30995, partial [Bradyrhizobium sp. WBOS2]
GGTGGTGGTGGGNLNFTGLGSFLGAGADPVYDPILVQGLQIAEQAITHVASRDPAGDIEELAFSSAGNMTLWADWVRASLYMTEFLRELDWRQDDRTVTLSYGRRRHHGDSGDHDRGERSFYAVRRPDSDCFKEQLKFMRSYLDQRPDRTPEIITQLGFPTPYFAMLLGLQVGANTHTFELITITQVLAAHVAMVVKHHLACRRPDRAGAQVMPMIPTPAHGTFPSAHATEAFAVATVLNRFVERQQQHYPDVKARQALITKLAERIAVNRTVAGVHFPIDTWAGAILGRAIGQIVLAKCRAGTTVNGYRYSAKGDLDFFVKEFAKGDNRGFGVTETGSIDVGSSELFEWLWNKASGEFDLVQEA